MNMYINVCANNPSLQRARDFNKPDVTAGPLSLYKSFQKSGVDF